LWYVNNGELHEIKGDKQPVGKTENTRPFTTHRLGKGNNAMYYLFTDGYPDQFGGPAGKKFKYKQLEDRLLAGSGLALTEQKQKLQHEFTSWKGSLEQVDDVCIVGVKL
jgi:serine phosphatase RsbU (regulator of sigma subunit)